MISGHSTFTISVRPRGILVLLALFFIGVSTVMAQSGTPFLFNIEHQRVNFKEFDASLSEPSIKDRMMCEKWCDDKVITMVDTLEAKFNFDLSESLFYINMNEKVFSVKSDFIKSFIIEGDTYINYKKPLASGATILQLMVAGKYTLYKHHNLKYKEPDFNPILNVGNKKGSFKKIYDYYAFCDDRLIEVSSKPKKALKKLRRECSISKPIKVKGDIVDLFHKLNSTEQ